MKKHTKKMIAPILAALGVLLYFALYFGVLIFLIPSVAVKVILGAFPLIFGAIVVAVLIQRIREIKGGEEDDLSQY
ncbi:MAG: hypothetical protein J6Z79_06385 [Clostridia bacterium]|nr:hypothetical protein [Clostridia bacterium]